jgi:hypothetical protein
VRRCLSSSPVSVSCWCPVLALPVHNNHVASPLPDDEQEDGQELRCCRVTGVQVVSSCGQKSHEAYAVGVMLL